MFSESWQLFIDDTTTKMSFSAVETLEKAKTDKSTLNISPKTCLAEKLYYTTSRTPPII